jgi:hypothetical protein
LDPGVRGKVNWRLRVQYVEAERQPENKPVFHERGESQLLEINYSTRKARRLP